MKKKQTNPIKVGSYEVVLKGKRVVVQSPEYKANGEVYPASTELAMSLSRAKEALGLQQKLLDVLRLRDERRKKIRDLDNQIMKLEDEMGTIQGEQEFGNYSVSATKGGLKFGCTFVSNKELGEIRKLVNEASSKE